ncbi:hypothetical protein HKCCE4037_02690 [Rhodobacterales bacterium HKCCE4037]|nr:hypothetical protein [Rhodobacterales bacterium HKCCE4037]
MIITNTDDHLKNHGFIYAGQNLWRLSPLFDVNPQTRRHVQMETGIIPVYGRQPDIFVAMDAAEFFDDNATEARALARDMAQSTGNTWRDELRRQVAGAGLNACAPAFEHERMDTAFRL